MTGLYCAWRISRASTAGRVIFTVVQDALSNRLGKLRLTLETTKVELVEFGRFA